MHRCTNTYTHAYTYIYTCPHTYTHTHIHIYGHTHTKCTYEMHANTLGTTARQRTCKDQLQTTKDLHFSFVWRNQTTFCTSNARTSLYPRPAALIPLHPPTPLPNIPQNSWKFAQFHNGPLRSCRKIGGKAVVQQSCSTKLLLRWLQ